MKENWEVCETLCTKFLFSVNLNCSKNDAYWVFFFFRFKKVGRNKTF